MDTGRHWHHHIMKARGLWWRVLVVKIKTEYRFDYILEVELRGLPDRFDMRDKLKKRKTFKFLT